MPTFWRIKFKMVNNDDLKKKIKEHFKPLMKNRKELYKVLKGLNEKSKSKKDSDFFKKLPKLVRALTSITKRKSIGKYYLEESKLYYRGTNCEVGVNCKGLGIIDYGSQLSPLAKDYEELGGYTSNSENFKILVEIFNNEELCLDISDVILNRNRKDFLKLATAFRNSGYRLLPKQDKVGIGDNHYLVFNIEQGQIDDLYKRDIEQDNEENDNILSGSDINDFCMKEMLSGDELFDYDLNFLLGIDNLLSEKKDEVVKAVKEVAKKYELSKGEEKLNVVISDMVSTYEALENI